MKISQIKVGTAIKSVREDLLHNALGIPGR